ncbi:MAG: hypothetical protein IH840_02920 [Candidatus Heimdallarchaeota archaeon]|nr:hypothetical protein [Candidatus Heimdallarchaeota archaeon]
MDTLEDEILYDVLYSADYGDSWVAIVKDYQLLSVDWDTRTVDNGEYLIQVSASIFKESVYLLSLSCSPSTISKHLTPRQLKLYHQSKQQPQKTKEIQVP